MLKILGLSSIVHIYRATLLLVMNKVVAIFLGPSGIAIVTQLQSVREICTSFATLNMSLGVTRQTAALTKPDKKPADYFLHAFCVMIVMSIFTSSVLFFQSTNISNYVLNNTSYVIIFQILAFTLPFYGASILLLAYLNGLQKYKIWFKCSIIQITTTLLNFLFFWNIFGEIGIYISLVTSHATFILILHFYPFGIEKYRGVLGFRFDYKKLIVLLKFSVMALVGIIFKVIVLISIRNVVAESMGTYAMGQWSALHSLITTISATASIIITTYLLPAFTKESVHKVYAKIRKAIINKVLPVIFLGCTVLYLFADYIIISLFSREFIEVSDFMIYYCFYIIFRILSVIEFNLIVARLQLKLIIFSDIFFACLLLILVQIFVPNSNLVLVPILICLIQAANYLFLLLAGRVLISAKEELDAQI